MLTPFNARDDWEMGVHRIGETGCIELRVRETARKVAEEAARDERQQRMCYWGYRFEQLSTSGPPGGRGGGGGGSSGYRIASPSDLASGAPLLGEGGLSEAEARRLKAAYAHLQAEEAPGGAGGSEGAVNANEEFCAVPCLDPTLALTLALALTLSLTLSLTLALALTLALTLGLTDRNPRYPSRHDREPSSKSLSTSPP